MLAHAQLSSRLESSLNGIFHELDREPLHPSSLPSCPLFHACTGWTAAPWGGRLNFRSQLDQSLSGNCQSVEIWCKAGVLVTSEETFMCRKSLLSPPTMCGGVFLKRDHLTALTCLMDIVQSI